MTAAALVGYWLPPFLLAGLVGAVVWLIWAARPPARRRPGRGHRWVGAGHHRRRPRGLVGVGFLVSVWVVSVTVVLAGGARWPLSTGRRWLIAGVLVAVSAATIVAVVSLVVEVWPRRRRGRRRRAG